MKIFNLYENVLREEEISQNAQNCVRYFGKELFGDEIFINQDEPNTPIEKKFSHMIYHFTDKAYGEQMSSDNPSFITAINKLKSCMSVYPEILHPEGDTAFRGISLSLDKAINLFQRFNGKYEFKLAYTPKTYIESWSENLGVGAQFAHQSQTPWLDDLVKNLKALGPNPSDEQIIETINDELTTKDYYRASKVGFIIKHKVTPDQFLFKAKYFKDLSSVPEEMEIIKIGNTPINCLWSTITPDIFRVLIPYLIKYKDKLIIFS
jgi:hypothetical protein